MFKKNAKYLFLSFLLLSAWVENATAFDNDLYFGMKANSEVAKLQDFLKEQGFFNEQSTGNFFNLTKEAIQRFQKSQGIIATGYFGSQTRTATLKFLNKSSSNKKASFKLLYPNQPQNFVENQPLTIKWISENYPNSGGIDIYLLKQISSTPKTYKLVKNIKTNTLNDGEERWVPVATDNGDNMIIQIGCGADVSGGCIAAISDNTFSVSRSNAMNMTNSNTATASVIESLQASISELESKIKILQR